MDDLPIESQQTRTNVKAEIIGGVTTFLTMAYIIFANPSILSLETVDPEKLVGIELMDKQALIVATCLASAIATILVGVFAKAPIAMAPGMGLNAFFAYSLMLGDKVPWQTALGAVFLSGLMFFVLTLIGLRRRVVEAIPPSLVSAISVGIGLFITFMGLVHLGVVVNHDTTLVTAGKLTPTVFIGFCGLLTMLFFKARRIRGSLLIGIAVATMLAAVFGHIDPPAKWISLDIDITPIAFKFDILGALTWAMFASICSLMFIDMFDSVGTLTACCRQAEMTDRDNKIKGLDRLLGIDAIATMIGAALGTSTTTAYIESAAGIEQGARKGLSSIVTGVLFLLALLFVPVIGIVPPYATAPALIMVGLFMMKEIKKIDFARLDQAFPAFIIIVMIALSYSISKGLAFGFVSFVLIKVVSGRARDVRLAMWLIAILSMAFLIANTGA